MSKKSWHTSNLCNQEKVWIAEQKAESEARKCAELREQIKVEREREEFDRLTKGADAVGDRGTNWMYEGGGAVAAAAASGIGGGCGASSAAAREEEEARRNEAYLLGKEYAPGGGARQSGDFAVASTMTGALEKASTYGATIGAGYAADSNGGGAKRLRIQEDTATTSSAAAAADGGDGAKTNNDEMDGDWSQNFHLRHEDPMFAVHQRRQAQLKDAEKKKRLLERAGLDVSVVARRDPIGGNDEDGEYRKGDASEGDGDDEDAGWQEIKRKRKRRSKSEKKKKKRSVREEEHRRNRHSKSKRDKHKRRNNNRNDDDRSSSSSPSYSSSSESVSSGRHRRHRDGRKGQRVHSTGYDGRRRRAEEDDYDDHSRNRDGSGRRGESRRSRSGSRRRTSGGEDNDHHRGRRTMRDYDEKDGRRRLDGHGDSRNRDDEGGRGDREQASSSAPSPSGTFNNDDKTGMAIAGGGRYGLVGTSVSNNDNGDGASTRHQQRRDRRDNNYLGPDRSLIESKRRAEAEERERVLKLSRKGDRR